MKQKNIIFLLMATCIAVSGYAATPPELQNVAEQIAMLNDVTQQRDALATRVEELMAVMSQLRNSQASPARQRAASLGSQDMPAGFVVEHMLPGQTAMFKMASKPRPTCPDAEVHTDEDQVIADPDIAALRDEVTRLQTLADQVPGLNADVARLQPLANQVPDLNEQIARLQPLADQVPDLNAEVARLQQVANQVPGLNADILRLQGELAAAVRPAFSAKTALNVIQGL